MAGIFTRHRPGLTPDVVALVLGEDEFHLRVPGVWDLLDIAATYQWPRLLPGALLDDDRELMNELLLDPKHKMSSGRLHIVVQSLGLYLYGWPFFVAARSLSGLMAYESAFTLWSVTHLTRDPATFSAAEWVSASINWQLSMSADKEEKRNARWAELTIPGRLPMDDPGVAPTWMNQ